MIISPGRNYVFVHIPKTGGTAMALALEARAMKDDILIGDTPKAQRRKRRLAGVKVPGRLWKHATLADVDGLVTRQMADEALIFTLVRNPWDRMVSYYHWLKTQTFDHFVVGLAQSVSFRDFVLDTRVQNSFGAAPAASYVTDARGQCRARFVRLEHLAKDLAVVEAHLGFALEMPRANESTRGAYQAYFDDETRDAVAVCCAADIEQFGYRFE